MEDRERRARERGLVTEAGGYRLFLSARTKSGYRGVTQNPITKKYNVEMGGGTDNMWFGGPFDTAVEAAVAYAARYEALETEKAAKEESKAATPVRR